MSEVEQVTPEHPLDGFVIHKPLRFHSHWVVRCAAVGKLKIKKSAAPLAIDAARLFVKTHGRPSRETPEGTLEMQVDKVWHPVDVEDPDAVDDSSGSSSVGGESGSDHSGSSDRASSAEMGGTGGGGTGTGDDQGSESGRDTVQATETEAAEGA